MKAKDKEIAGMLGGRVFITIDHLNEYKCVECFRVGDVLSLKKDFENCYDDEAISVYDSDNCKCGYVANSVETVCRGTYSAGRIYDKIDVSNDHCTVCFISNSFLIALITDNGLFN